MNIVAKPKIVLLGMMSRMPVAGVVWQTVQYLVGFEHSRGSSGWSALVLQDTRLAFAPVHRLRSTVIGGGTLLTVLVAALAAFVARRVTGPVLEITGSATFGGIENLGIAAVPGRKPSYDWTKLTANRNTVPFDERPPMVASGVRIGTPAATMRGFDEDDFREVSSIIVAALSDDADVTALADRAAAISTSPATATRPTPRRACRTARRCSRHRVHARWIRGLRAAGWSCRSSRSSRSITPNAFLRAV